jgi:hypothetical protein
MRSNRALRTAAGTAAEYSTFPSGQSTKVRRNASLYRLEPPVEPPVNVRIHGVKRKPRICAGLSSFLGKGDHVGKVKLLCSCVMTDLCRLIFWTLVDLMRAQATLEADIWVVNRRGVSTPIGELSY